MTITTEQRERRRSGLTGSDAPAIVGVSPFGKTPLSVWLDKKLPLKADEPDEMQEYGNALEPIIARRWSRRTGLSLIECDTLTHPEHPWIIGHPDYLVAGRAEGMECKLVQFRQDDWGPPDSDFVPPYVHLQCDHYMMITGFERWHVAAQFGLRETRLYTIERDERVIARLFEWERAFWQMVLDDVRPDVLSPADIDRMFPNDAGTAIATDAAIDEALRSLRHARSERDSWGDLADTLEAQVKAYMGDHATLTDSMGTPLATWKKAKPGKRLDMDRLRAAHPDLVNEFMKQTEGSRRFLLKETR